MPLTNRRPPPPATTTTARHHHDSHAGRCASLGPYPAWPGRVLLRVSPVAAPGIVVAAAAWRDASGVEWTERAPPGTGTGTGTGSPGPIPNFAPRSPHTERRPPGSSSVPPRLHSLAQRRAFHPAGHPTAVYARALQLWATIELQLVGQNAAQFGKKYYINLNGNAPEYIAPALFISLIRRKNTTLGTRLLEHVSM